MLIVSIYKFQCFVTDFLWNPSNGCAQVWWTDRHWWKCVLKGGNCLSLLTLYVEPLTPAEVTVLAPAWSRDIIQLCFPKEIRLIQMLCQSHCLLSWPISTRFERQIEICAPVSFLKISDCAKTNAQIIATIWVINSGCVGGEITRSEPEQTEREVACCDRDANWRSWVSSKSR